METDRLAALGAGEAALAVAQGAVSSEELVRACLDRIAARDGDISAFVHLDREHALDQARRADAHRREGHALPPLHGVPVAVKDVIDTEDFPTEHGSPIFAGHRPDRDATLVARLREAGAILIGKTASTEFALFHPAATKNPRAPGRTPGGSSSGSAASVADFMAPLAIGTQTAGSVIRPAAYCGVYGFKPSFGLISRHGVLPQSPELDTVGLFARGIEDLALLADAIAGFDPADPAMRPAPRTPLRKVAASDAPARPRLAFVKSPAWPDAEAVTVSAFAELVAELGGACEEVALRPAFDGALDLQRTVQMAGVAAWLGPYQRRAPDMISPILTQRIEEGRRIAASDYIAALDARPKLSQALDVLFDDYDAILTPSAPGPAPEGLAGTGSPAFCALWTYLRVPAVTLPLLDADGAPMGVQLVGRFGDDGRLLRTARWLERRLSGTDAA
jgi:Asp-tRNA(Asn)/Glu-tRNA(Gln) amidotransferase A subunit family amidase